MAVVVPAAVTDQILQLLALLLLVVVVAEDTSLQTEIVVVRAVAVVLVDHDRVAALVYQAKVMQVVVGITMVVKQVPLLKQVEEEVPQVVANVGMFLLLSLLTEVIMDVADAVKHLQ